MHEESINSENTSAGCMNKTLVFLCWLTTSFIYTQMNELKFKISVLLLRYPLKKKYVGMGKVQVQYSHPLASRTTKTASKALSSS